MREAIPEFTIRAGDLTSVGFCRGGSRDYFKHLGLDWNDFLTNGISSATLHAFNDAMADKLIASVRSQRGL